jgi:sugar phosphate isomerase/epimerase
MIELGIFAKTFTGTLPEIFSAVHGSGINRIQFNFACANLPSMPDHVDEKTKSEILSALLQTPLSIDAVSGTFNMVHPDNVKRKSGLNQLEVIAMQCKWLGTNLITLCTGSRDEADMWKAHPGNNKPDAWHDLRETLDGALEIAGRFNLILGIEPESGNVINSIDKAARLIKEVNSPRLGIVFDPANLFERETSQVIRERIAYGLEKLEDHIISAHAKDRNAKGEVVAAGKGMVPYPFYLEKLTHYGYKGSLIIHGLAPGEVPDSIAYLTDIIQGIK